jgi:predicted DNA-binding protein
MAKRDRRYLVSRISEELYGRLLAVTKKTGRPLGSFIEFALLAQIENIEWDTFPPRRPAWLGPRKRQIGLKVTEELQARLKAAKARSGASQADIVELGLLHRIERAEAPEPLLPPEPDPLIDGWPME